MDKKLIAAFTFGLLAVSAANVLLSVGIVSLLLTWSPGTDVQVTDTGNFPGTWMETMNAVSLTGMNNTTTNTNASKADMPAVNVTITPLPSTDQMTSTGMPAGGQFTPPSGQLPPSGQWSQVANGQAPPSGQLPSSTGQTTVSGQVPAGSGQTTQAAPASSGSGQVPSNGQIPSGSGQVPSTGQIPSGSGQVPSTGQIPSDTSQLTSGTGQYMSGTGSIPASGMSSSMGIGDLSADLASIFNGQAGMASPATATPNPDLSFFNNMTSMIANQQSGT